MRAWTAPRASALFVSFILIATAACSSPDAPEPHVARPAGTLTWSGCGDGAECTTLSVPVDHTRPEGAQISLALARRQAGSESKRRGVLLVNPGGPGAEARSLVLEASSLFSDAIRERFDLVAWDPRGTGESGPISCLAGPELDAFWAVDRSPDTAAEERANVTSARNFAQRCDDRDPALLPHVGTRASVADMEQVRVALGDPVLNFLAFSYGTELGALYADAYPTRVGRFVLDGPVDLSRSYADATLDQAVGFERALGEFLDDCSARASSAFHSGGDAGGAYDKLMAAVDAEPQYAMLHDEERVLGPGEFDTGVARALYDGASGWPRLAEALRTSAQGDGSQLLALADEYTGRGPDGSYGAEDGAFYAIGCLDGEAPPSAAAIDALAADVAESAPRLGPSTAWLGLPCTYWPVPPDPLAVPNELTTGPVLVVATTRDPATPYAWGEALAAQLGAAATLLTFDGGGHTAYAAGSECIDAAVEHYLIDGVVPKAGTSCT